MIIRTCVCNMFLKNDVINVLLIYSFAMCMLRIIIRETSLKAFISHFTENKQKE